MKTVKVTRGNISFYSLYKNVGIDFWQSYTSGTWEAQTLNALDRYLLPDHSFIDIGAWIGPISLYGSHIAKHCYAIEPDPQAYSELINNINLNENIKNKISTYNCCIDDCSGYAKIGSINIPGNSISGFKWAESENSWTVKSFTLSDLIKINNISNFNFIKIDIEGGEAKVIPSMTNIIELYRPTLFISMHPWWMDNVEKDIKNIFDTLSSYKYLYLRDGSKLDVKNINEFAAITSPNSSLSDIIATDIKN